MSGKARRRTPRAKAVPEAPDVAADRMWLWLLSSMLDRSDPYELLNDRELRAGMRELVKRMQGNLTRPDVATQAFVFAASLERERLITLVSRMTWPCHDDLSEACVEERELVVEA